MHDVFARQVVALVDNHCCLNQLDIGVGLPSVRELNRLDYRGLPWLCGP